MRARTLEGLGEGQQPLLKRQVWVRWRSHSDEELRERRWVESGCTGFDREDEGREKQRSRRRAHAHGVDEGGGLRADLVVVVVAVVEEEVVMMMMRGRRGSVNASRTRIDGMLMWPDPAFD